MLDILVAIQLEILGARIRGTNLSLYSGVLPIRLYARQHSLKLS